MTTKYPTEIVDLGQLINHPRNYQEHPASQIEHLIESITENGIYRNVVVARDLTILAGHGVVKALIKMGEKDVPVIRLDLDPLSPKALKILAGDNEIKNLAEINLPSLAEILGDINQDDNLIGTGYDEMMLSSLLLITGHQPEIVEDNNGSKPKETEKSPASNPTKELDEFQEWENAGMDTYNPYTVHSRVEVSFLTEEDRELFASKLGIELSKTIKNIWYPTRDGD